MSRQWTEAGGPGFAGGDDYACAFVAALWGDTTAR